MTTCKVWTKKGSLEEFWNGAHLEDEEREDLEIRRYLTAKERPETPQLGDRLMKILRPVLA